MCLVTCDFSEYYQNKDIKEYTGLGDSLYLSVPSIAR